VTIAWNGLASEDVHKAVDRSIREVRDAYKRSERNFLTEADIVSSLIQALRKHVQCDRIAIHSQLRPFLKKNGKVKVIGEERSKDKSRKRRWIEQKRANKGARFDIALVSRDEKHWKKALENAKEDQGGKLKYWRILSYPLEAFHAIVETKVRVSGNIDEIRGDIERLVMVRQENPRCLTFLVVMDKKAKSKDLERIEGIMTGILGHDWRKTITFYSHQGKM